MSAPKGFLCPSCRGVRVHRIRTLKTEGKLLRVKVCSVCSCVSSMSIIDQPGIVCPKCGDVRLLRLFTRQHPGRIVRVRKCYSCGWRIRTRETVESFAG